MAATGGDGTRAPEERPIAAGLRGIGTGVEMLLGVVLIAVVLINVANAAGRYLLRTSLTGTDEIMVFSMVFIVVVGAVLALARRSHIAIDLLPTYASARMKLALYVVHDLVALAATGYAAWASWSFVKKLARIGTESMTLGIPMTIPHSALLAGFVGMAVVSAVYLVRDAIALATLLAAGSGRRAR